MPVCPKTVELIHDWIDFACDRNDVGYLASHIRVGWSNRFTRKFAEAGYGTNPLRAHIRISGLLWVAATESQRYETILHECSHIFAWHLHGTDIKPHGAEWRAAMANCGVAPDIYHDVDLVGINRFFVRECHKTDRCYVSRRKLAALRRGEVLHCTICSLRVDAQAIED